MERKFGYWAIVLSASLVGGTISAFSRADATEPLSVLAQAAKGEFHAPTPADLVQAKQAVVAAAEGLQRQFEQAGASAEGWKAYLIWDTVQATLQNPAGADKMLLAQTYDRLTRGHHGLEMAWFVDLREAIQTYLNLANALEMKDLKARYTLVVEGLAKRLENYPTAATPENARIIGETLRWLSDLGEAPALVQAARQNLRYPNVYVEISPCLAEAGIPGAVDETECITDCILGTSIQGTAHMVAQVHAQFVPSEEHGVLDTVMLGTATSQNSGYHKPVTIFSSSVTQIASTKRLLVDANGWTSLPAVSTAVTCSHIDSICAPSALVERIAWKRVGQQKGEAELVASSHAQQRVNTRVDERSAGMVAENNAAFEEKFRQPMLERKVFPEQLLFSTTADVLRVRALEAAPFQLAAPTAPADPPAGCDLTIRVHETTVNNAGYTALSGKLVDEDILREQVQTTFHKLPDALKPNPDRAHWTLTFAKVPVTVTFGENEFRLIIRGANFTFDTPLTQGKLLPPMNITATYKLFTDDKGVLAIRQGPLEIFPPNFVAGSGRQLTPEQTITHRQLEKRLAPVLKEKLRGDPIRFEGPLARVGALVPVSWTSNAGWMTIGYKLAPPPADIAHPTVGN
jgi:hypothetical protein